MKQKQRVEEKHEQNRQHLCIQQLLIQVQTQLEFIIRQNLQACKSVKKWVGGNPCINALVFFHDYL